MKFVLLISLVIAFAGGEESTNSNDFCSSFVCIPSNYNKMDMPNSDDNDKGPLKVSMSMFLLDIYKINYEDFTMDLNVFMKFSWIDNRLIINDTSSNGDVDVNFIRKLWVPDIYIYDLKNLLTRRTITPEEGLSIKNEDGNKRLTYIFEPEVVVVCPIDYSEFPFHSHTCSLQITSFSRTSDKMEFVTDQSWVPGKALDNDKIRDYNVNVSYLIGEQTKRKGWTGKDWSVVGLQIELESRYDKYIYIYYIPTTMFTLTSWVSFLLPPTCYPARTTLLVTVFLCQIGVFNAVIRDTPNKDGGMTALELWCLACIAFVFQALISYVVILARIGYKEYKGSKGSKVKENRMDGYMGEKRDVMLEWILFSWVFGSAFIFNLFYWTKKRSVL